MSKIEVDAIDKQSGSTLTLGGSGTAVTLACGATQTGFGRTGTVDWQTAIKTAGFTAVSGEGYFCDTTSGSFTVTLPASPSAGDIVAVKDYAGTFDTENLILGRNSSNIEGLASNKTLDQESLSITFVYADATKGWLAVNDMSTTQLPQFVTATGGTVTTVCTNFKVHTFTGPGTFTVTNAGNADGSNKVDYLVVAGGGGGGTGGGGAGGYRESPGTTSGCYSVSPLGAAPAVALPVSSQDYPIAVGGGGTLGQNCCTAGGPGAVSTFSTITSTGGGGGKVYNQSSPDSGNGGSGGGGALTGPHRPAGSGNTPPVSPAQGKDAAAGDSSTPGRGGGGGGATVAAAFGPGVGGAGATSSINATPTARAGGGGAGGFGTPVPSAAGGSGGGGAGGIGSSGAPGNAGTAGTVNTGGGGGGAGYYPGAPSNSINAGAGGSGIVIIRYKFQ
jgi:hypothetical protein